MSTLEGPAVRARTRARTGVRRATWWAWLVLAGTVTACDPAPVHKRVAMVPIGTTPLVNEPSSSDEPPEAASTTSTSSNVAAGACTGSEVDPLEVALRGCEVPMPKSGELPVVTKDKLEISLSAPKAQVAPGARLELTLTLRNKQSEPLALVFTGDPTPHVELEALDAKGKRADRPAGKPPARPEAKGREAKASRFTLAPNGVARVHLAWDAVKLRWAPERQKTWEGHGPPTAPAGPLPRGKYTLRAVVPLLGVFERGDVELPKIVVDVG